MKTVATRALILKCINYGESDRIVTASTEKLGKVRAIARGARKSLKRFGGCLEPFTLLSLVLRPGKGLFLVTEGSIVKNFSEIKGDIEKFASGSYLLELTDAISLETGEGGGEFPLLLSGLRELSACTNPRAAIRAYEIRLLALIGYLPQFIKCIACGADLSGPVGGEAVGDGVVAFSIKRGGALCGGCKKETGDETAPISIGTLKTLDKAVKGGISFSKFALEESGKIITPFINRHIGKKMKSLDFLAGLKKIGHD